MNIKKWNMVKNWPYILWFLLAFTFKYRSDLYFSSVGQLPRAQSSLGKRYLAGSDRFGNLLSR